MAEVADRWHRRHAPDGAAGCPEHKGLVPSADHGRGRRWLARWRDDAGKQRAQAFTRKVDAENHLVEVADSQRRGVYVDPGAGKRRLRDYATEWLAQQTTEASTREVVKRRLRLHVYPGLGDLELRAIRPSTVQSWLRGLSDRLAPNHVRVVYAHLTTIMNAAVADGLIARSPCQAASVKPPAPERPRVVPWTAKRVAAVTAELPGRYQVVAVLAAGLGLRLGECLGLAVEDVDFLRHVVHVRRQVKRVGKTPVFSPPKGGRERDVPLPEAVSLRLAAHLQSYPATAVTLPWRQAGGREVTARLVVTRPDGAAVDRWGWGKAWRPALAAAGVPAGGERGVHQLRHYFASVALDGGVSIKALAAYLGHASEAFTLAVYCHLMPASEGRLRTAVDAAFNACAPDVHREASDAP